MSPSFITIPIETDAEQTYRDGVDILVAQFPGWTDDPGAVEAWILRAVAFINATTAELSADVPAEIFREFGQKIIGLPPQDAVSATVASTWTMRDTAGYTIAAGTEVGLRAAGDDLVAFQVRDDVQIDPGDDATAAGEVILEAVLAGIAANGLGGTPELISAIAEVEGIAIIGTATGGIDAETGEEYLDRLADELRLLAPRPILPQDFAVLARRNPAVVRSVAIDGYDPDDPGDYDPDDPETWTERMVAVAIVDGEGQELDSDIKDEVQADLEARREINFVVNVIDPTYTTVDVRFTVVPYAGNSLSEVNAAVIDALTSYLSPATWGQNLGAQPAADIPTDEWVNETVVRYQDLSTLINNTPGVNYHSALQLRKGAAAYATTDVSLDGPAPLAQPGAIAAI